MNSNHFDDIDMTELSQPRPRRWWSVILDLLPMLIQIVKPKPKRTTQNVFGTTVAPFLTKNFSFSEFHCHDGTKVPPEYYPNVRKLAEQLEIIREALGRPITINSGYRSPRYNKRIGGAKFSRHLLAQAADFKDSVLSPVELRDLILRLINQGKIVPGGLGLYKTFVHYDIRGKLTLWSG